MTMAELIAAAEQRLADAVATRRTRQDTLISLRSKVEGGDTTVTVESIQEAVAARDAADADIKRHESDLATLRAEQAEDERINQMQSTVTRTGTGRAYDQVARVGQESRTYVPETDKRGRGKQFLTDVAAAFRGDFNARGRLERHMNEEMVERGSAQLTRATSTANFTGWVIPQYLVEMNAPAAVAGRPFADVCNGHDLPETGMTMYLSKVTTGSSVADQSSEGATVSATDMDDTQIPISVRTAAGSATISRQAIERGSGVDDVTFGDLLKRYNKNLDSNLLNAATHGLTNVATGVTYTDASPTAAELYPKIQSAAATSEGVFLDGIVDGLVAVMAPRRWRWLSSQMTSTWPFVSGPGAPVQAGIRGTGELDGKGIRGYLPDGTPVVTDANVAVNLGTGTNEDEIYLVAPEEAHLWEDPSAPMLIRAETNPKGLQLDLVVYGYYAFYLDRYAGGHTKIGGTGLVTPTF